MSHSKRMLYAAAQAARSAQHESHQMTWKQDRTRYGQQLNATGAIRLETRYHPSVMKIAMAYDRC